MQIITDPSNMQLLALEWRKQALHIALVPTMGYFHAGHESLMRAAKASAAKHSGKVITSLFVNPTQFAPNEDLDKYPHNFDRDAAIAEELGVDILFAPQSRDIYYPDHATWIDVPELAHGLCGQARPTHFRGVATVVAKLFMLTQPNEAFFGQKDWQQLAIIHRMVRDLNIPTQIHGCPIVREPDGLAMSSRNVYLTPQERSQAPHLHKGLLRAQELFAYGERSSVILSETVREYWGQHLPLGREDYLSFVSPESLAPLETLGNRALIATAIYFGKARLLDNLLLERTNFQV